MLASSPTAPMTVRNFPRDRCAAAPIFSISPTTRSIDACGALGFMTIITDNSCTYAAKQPGVEKSGSVRESDPLDNSSRLPGLEPHQLGQMVKVFVARVQRETMLKHERGNPEVIDRDGSPLST